MFGDQFWKSAKNQHAFAAPNPSKLSAYTWWWGPLWLQAGDGADGVAQEYERSEGNGHECLPSKA